MHPHTTALRPRSPLLLHRPARPHQFTLHPHTYARAHVQTTRTDPTTRTCIRIVPHPSAQTLSLAHAHSLDSPTNTCTPTYIRIQLSIQTALGLCVRSPCPLQRTLPPTRPAAPCHAQPAAAAAEARGGAAKSSATTGTAPAKVCVFVSGRVWAWFAVENRRTILTECVSGWVVRWTRVSRLSSDPSTLASCTRSTAIPMDNTHSRPPAPTPLTATNVPLPTSTPFWSSKV